jgi:hypothetical protein
MNSVDLMSNTYFILSEYENKQCKFYRSCHVQDQSC